MQPEPLSPKLTRNHPTFAGCAHARKQSIPIWDTHYWSQGPIGNFAKIGIGIMLPENRLKTGWYIHNTYIQYVECIFRSIHAKGDWLSCPAFLMQKPLKLYSKVFVISLNADFKFFGSRLLAIRERGSFTMPSCLEVWAACSCFRGATQLVKYCCGGGWRGGGLILYCIWE